VLVLFRSSSSSNSRAYLATAALRPQQIGERVAALAALRKAHESKRDAYKRKRGPKMMLLK
jgi:hypothetical protein